MLNRQINTGKDINSPYKLSLFFLDADQKKYLSTIFPVLCPTHNTYTVTITTMQEEQAVLRICNKTQCAKGNTTLAESLVQDLMLRSMTLSAVESCTGGTFSALLTQVSGCSKVFWGSIIAYTAQAKHEFLDVAPDILERDGTVSMECAQMLRVAMEKKSKTSYTVAIVGVAGTDPVMGITSGNVCISLSSPATVLNYNCSIRGNRVEIQQSSSYFALFALREMVLKSVGAEYRVFSNMQVKTV